MLLRTAVPPIFVDIVQPRCMDPTKVEAAITTRPGHYSSPPAWYPAIESLVNLATTHGLWVVEDATEAVFARYKDRLCGSLGNAAIFSFSATKYLRVVRRCSYL